MIFSWDESNREHLARHNVEPAEAEEILGNLRHPFPRATGAGKYMGWAKTIKGRYLQVVFALKDPEEVSYESVTPEDWQALKSNEKIIRIVHAMDLTDGMKRRFFKRSR